MNPKDKMTQAEWSSPGELCAYLGLMPTKGQQKLLDAYTAGQIDFSDTPDNVRALGICMLWEVLKVQGITCYLTCEDRRTRQDIIRFMEKVLQQSPCLMHVTTIGKRGFTFGCDPNWQILAVQGSTSLGRTEGSIVLILGAASYWAIGVEQAAAESKAKVVRTF